MKVTAIIPARYASSRLKGKVLLTIADKPMIQHVYERTKKASLVNNVIVATDDRKIFDVVEGFAGNAAMTSPLHRTGTDRIAEVADNMDAEIIVNVQGDEPLIEPEMIDAVVRPLLENPDLVITTLKKKITNEGELKDPNIVKVVTSREGFAIYFSRFPIPYERERSQKENIHYKHIGLYGYRKDFLLKFAKMTPTPLEEAEKLEQLRALENGYKIKVIETQYSSIGVDTQEDLERVRKIAGSMK